MASLLSLPNFLSLTTQPPKSSYRTYTTKFNNFKPKTTLLLQPSSLAVGISTTRRFRRHFAVAEQATVTSPKEADRKLYIGNIPRTVTNDELAQIVQEHGSVEKAEVFFFSSLNFVLLVCLVYSGEN